MNFKSKLHIFLGAVLLSLFAGQLSVFVAQTSQEWQEFSSTENRFSVSLPGTPQKLSRTAEAFMSEGKARLDSFQFRNEKTLFFIGSVSEPTLPPQPDGWDPNFEFVKYSIREIVDGKISSKTNVQLEGYPGGEMTGLATYQAEGKKSQVKFTARNYFVDRSLYLVLVASFDAEMNNQDFSVSAVKFLDSFKLHIQPRVKKPINELPGTPPPGVVRVSSGILLGVLAIKKVDPGYPKEAKAAGADGSVKIRVLISEEGKLIEAEVLSGHELLRSAALDAAKKWTFRKWEKDGKPVKVESVLTFHFTFK
jgi:TonB family protein